MMKDDNKDFMWLKKPVFNYTDSKTTIVLSICLESGMTKGMLCTTRLVLDMADSRVQGYQSVRMDLEFPQIIKLYDDLTNLRNQSEQPWINAFKQGSSINIQKFKFKSRQDLTFKFILGNPAQVNLIITDSVKNLQRSSMFIDGQTFKCFYAYLGSMINNIALIDVTMMNSIYQKQTIQEMVALQDNIKNIKLPEITINQVQEQTSFEETPTIELDSIEQLPEEVSNEPSDIQQNFHNHIKDFQSIDLGISDIQDATIREENRINNYLPFVNNFLNNDIVKIKEWNSVFTNLNEKTNSENFDYIGTILKIANVGQQEIDDIRNQPGYFETQYTLLYMLKDYTRKYISDPTVYKTLNKEIPKFKFDETIKKDSETYKVCKEIIITYILYSIYVQSALNSINTFDEVKSSEHKRALMMMKLLLSPFIFSLHIDDIEEVKNEIVKDYSIIIQTGFLEKLEKEYSDLTAGGRIKITLESVTTNIENVLKSIINNNTLVFGDSTVYETYSVPQSFGFMVNSEDIKRGLFKNESVDKNDVYTEETIVEQDLHKEPEMDDEQIDEKLKLYLDCCSEYMPEEFINTIRHNAKTMDDVQSIIVKKHLTIVDEVFKIKSLVTKARQTPMTKEEVLAEVEKQMNRVTVETSTDKYDIPDVDIIDYIYKTL